MKGPPDRGGPWVHTSPPAHSSPEQQDEKSSSIHVSQSERAALEALLRYETMVRTQDAEYQAISLHLRPLFEGIKEFARREGNTKKGGRRGGGSFFGFGRSSPSKKPTSIVSEQCIEFESIKSVYRLLCAAGEDAEASQDVKQELMRSDRQLIYILELLSEDNNANSDATKSETKATLTFAEFVQCYQTAVSGMQCIQQITGEDAFEIRRRTVDRTAWNVRSFGPGGGESNGTLQQQTGKSLQRLSSNSHQGLAANTTTLSARMFGGDDATGELEEEIDYLRKLLAVKDKQLVRVLTDHAHNVESISYERDKKAEEIGLYIRKRRRRRRRLRKALMLLMMLLFVFCYHIGVIRIVESNVLPRVSVLLNELVEYIGLAERDELKSLKQDALTQKNQISTLKAQERQLLTELKRSKAKLDITTEDLSRAKENLKMISPSVNTCAPASSAALDSCRAEMRKAREEVASLRLERQGGSEMKQQELLQVDSGWFKSLLLGPFQGMLTKYKATSS